MLTQQTLKKLMHYDPYTGVFTRIKSPWHPASVGVEAGSTKKHGNVFYREISIFNRPYQGHRLAFLYMTGEWPNGLVDHKDRDGLNNRWVNLRIATLSQNAANAKRYSTNSSGFKGVTYHRGVGRWQAQIKKDGKNFYLGLHDTPETAHAAYVAKAQELFGEFARTA